jgi:hypothetical protein
MVSLLLDILDCYCSNFFCMASILLLTFLQLQASLLILADLLQPVSV